MKSVYAKGLFALCFFSSLYSFSQASGDYKSNGTGGGAWNAASTWLRYNGSSYVVAGAAPSNASNAIVIQNADAVSVTSAETINALIISAGGSLAVASGQSVTLGGNLTVDGSLTVNGSLLCGVNIIQGTGSFVLSSGATINIGSATGIASSGATGNVQTTTRSFSAGANYTFTGTAAQVTGNGLPSGITGIVTDNNSQATSGLTLSASLTLTAPGSFAVPSGSVLTCPNAINIAGTGNFTLTSGAALFIGSLQGISNAAATGNIQVTGTKTFSASANYTYYGTGLQSTGTAFPSPFTGTVTFANTGGSGTLLSGNLTVTAPGLVNVTGAIATGTNVISGTGTFTLNSNATLLTAHVDGLDAVGATGSIQTAVRNLITAANYTYYASAPQMTGPGLPATVTSLYINTTSTVSLTNDVTLNGTLTLQNGTFCLNGKSLNIPSGRTVGRNNGVLQLCGGTLNYMGTVNVTYLGSSSVTTGLEIPPSASALIDLTINGAGKVVTLGQNITVNNTLTMTAGSLQLGGYNLIYSPSSKLVYNGAAAQTVGVEWPSAAFDRNIQIANTFISSGLALNADKLNYTGTLTVLSNGYFNSSGYSLFGTGNLAVNSGGTYITPHAAGVSTGGAIQLTGTRTFSAGSSYTFNGSAVQISGAEMPASVTNLTINNTSAAASAVVLTAPGGGTLTVGGTVTLTAGVLDAATNNVNLIFQTGNAPIDRTNGTLTPFAGGFLQFGSAGNTGGSAFVIPNNTFTSAPVLNNLIINRTNALTLGNQNITLNGTLTLTAGILDIGNTTLTFQTGNTPVSITAGSLTTGSAASLQFGTAGNTTGAAFTLPNNLFTAAPTLNNLTVNRTNALTLGTQAITVGGVLTLTSGALNIGNGTLGLNGTLSLTAGILNGGATSNLSVGGSGANLTLPSTVTTLNNLTVARPNAGAVPAVTLAGALAISGGINLSGGSLSLGANNLTLSPAATIANFTASRYIITANTPASGGFLIRNAGATATFFPVGTGSYTPLTINNAGGTADNFRVRVFDGLLSGGTSGSTDANINHAVNKTWVVEEATTGGSAATITAQWNTTDENASFARNASLVAQHDGTAWGSSSTGAAATNVSAGVWSRFVPNVTSFSSFSVQDVLGTPLPIKWLAFTAVRQGTTVQLRWLAQSSDPNYWFEIERSGDNLNFEHIGAVQGQGLDGLAVYTLADNTPLMCTKSFYRIRQVSTTGASAYSPVRVVDGERGEALSLQLYPLPAKEVVYVHFNCSESNKAVIAVIDAAGNTVQRQTVTVVKGINLFEISVNDLPQGLYILTLRLGKDSYRAKLMK